MRSPRRPLLYLLSCYTAVVVIFQTWRYTPTGSSMSKCNPPTQHVATANTSADEAMIQRYMEHNSPRITSSPKSRRRFLATVASMPDAHDRREVFYNAWKEAWPDLNIFPMYSFANNPGLMGYALLAINALQMHKALEFSNSTGQDFDYLIIFEDDALPFENTTWPDDLDIALDEFEARQGGALYLGCHAVYSWERKKLAAQNGSTDSHIAEIVWAYGSYAWMIPRSRLQKLYRHFLRVLKNKKGKWDGASDTSAHEYFRDFKISHHITVPLLVDHRSHGKSSTFAEQRDFKDAVKTWYSFEGRRDWWNFEDSIGIFQPKGLPRMDNRGETK